MNEKDFVLIVKKAVVGYANEHLDKTDGKKITEDDVFIVWMCKTLQNNKALASTTLFDGMYYEITYNGDKNEMYFDAYKKWENKCIKIDCSDCAYANRLDDKAIECTAKEYDIEHLSCFTPKNN